MALYKFTYLLTPKMGDTSDWTIIVIVSLVPERTISRHFVRNATEK